MAGDVNIKGDLDIAGVVNALGLKDLVQFYTSVANRGIDAGANAVSSIVEDRKALVEVAEVHSDDYLVTVDEARRWLEEDGLKVEPVVAKPNVTYKDCADSEVVATNFKLGEKVKPGTRIILRYVTSEVVEASQKLYEEAEREKVELEQQKAEKAAQSKQAFNNKVKGVQQGIGGAAKKTQEGVKGIFSKIPKKKKSDDASE